MPGPEPLWICTVLGPQRHNNEPSAKQKLIYFGAFIRHVIVACLGRRFNYLIRLILFGYFEVLFELPRYECTDLVSDISQKLAGILHTFWA